MNHLHNPRAISPREALLAALRRTPTAEVTGYDIATRAGLTAKKAAHYLSDLAGRGEVVRVAGIPARYRLAAAGGGVTL